ncbi:MAG: hypothetical protein QOE37_1208 [Microbacteriaceae bacterium]|nr:hypothetical protein [Microbacteriaceae bacterium]
MITKVPQDELTIVAGTAFIARVPTAAGPREGRSW